MKNLAKLFGIVVLAAIIGFSMTSCASVPKSSGPYKKEFSATNASEFNARWHSIGSAAGDYLINLTENITLQSIGLTAPGVNITVRGTGSNKITWNPRTANDKTLVYVEAGKLTLENISLDSASGSSGPIVAIFGGAVEVKDGVIISNIGNIGVYISKGGEFTMTGGTIKNTTQGVYLDDGKNVRVTINGGTIEDSEFGIFGGPGGAAGLTGASINISGGTEISAIDAGIWMGSTSTNAVVNITGGTIKGLNYGINERSTGTAYTVNGGKVSGNNGVRFSGLSLGSSLTLLDGEISGAKTGVLIGELDDDSANIVSKATVTISGGKLSGVEDYGVVVEEGRGHTVTKSAGATVVGSKGQYSDATGAASFTGF